MKVSRYNSEPDSNAETMLPISKALPMSSRVGLLHGLYLLRDLLHPAAVDQLMEVQRGAAVRALGPLLRQPAPHARVAAQLRAVRAQVGIHQLLHTDEASEHLRQRLK